MMKNTVYKSHICEEKINILFEVGVRILNERVFFFNEIFDFKRNFFFVFSKEKRVKYDFTSGFFKVLFQIPFCC